MSIGAFIVGCSGPTLSRDERDFFQRTAPFGLILFRRNCQHPEQIKELIASFREAVDRKDAAVLVDQEGGRVQRLAAPYWRPYAAASRFGDQFQDDPLRALRAACLSNCLMARDLSKLGINICCAPVLDVPISGAHDVIGDRAFSSKPLEIIALARAQLLGFKQGGVLPVMKHIPGHGRSEVDSHHHLPIVDASLSELEKTDFVPFAALADVPMAMTAHVIYKAIDPVLPATLSPTVIGTIVREMIGFDGLLMSDDIAMKALSGTTEDKCRAALHAGCDVILHCNGDMSEMVAVAQASGSLKGTSLARARSALKTLTPAKDFIETKLVAELESLI